MALFIFYFIYVNDEIKKSANIVHDAFNWLWALRIFYLMCAIIRTLRITQGNIDTQGWFSTLLGV